MYHCGYYLLIEPLLPEYHDDETIKPSAFSILNTNSKDYTISYFVQNNQISMIRIEIPDLPSEKISESDVEVIHVIKEHLLSVLRLTYDHSITLFSRPLWTFVEEGKELSLHVSMSKTLNPDFEPYVENVRNVFNATFPFRVQLKLISDSQDTQMPLQYRYLSLYKLLEIEFKKKGKWTSEFDNFVKKHNRDFISFGKKTSLKKYIHALRDRCSHIMSRKEVLGVTQLSQQDMIEVNVFLPFLSRICMSHINEEYDATGFSIVNRDKFFEFVRR